MTRKNSAGRIVVAVTGASGAVYAVRLIEQLCRAGMEVHLIVSTYGRQLLSQELDIQAVSPQCLGVPHADLLCIHPFRDVGSVLSSGSFLTEGMVICPCSSNTLGAIAAGLGDNLVHRAAAVTLKEKRRLILVTREMPMGHIDLENALRLSGAGAIICPAAPGFYMKPTSIDDLVDFVVGKIMDLVGVDHQLHTRWSDQLADRPTKATFDRVEPAP